MHKAFFKVILMQQTFFKQINKFLTPNNTPPTTHYKSIECCYNLLKRLKICTLSSDSPFLLISNDFALSRIFDMPLCFHLFHQKKLKASLSTFFLATVSVVVAVFSPTLLSIYCMYSGRSGSLRSKC